MSLPGNIANAVGATKRQLKDDLLLGELLRSPGLGEQEGVTLGLQLGLELGLGSDSRSHIVLRLCYSVRYSPSVWWCQGR